MPLDLQIQNNILHILLRGRLASDDLEQLLNVVEKAEAEQEVPHNRMIDFSQVEGIDLPSATLEAIAERRRHATPRTNVKTAIVAPSALLYGLSRMYQTIAENPKIDLQIFTDGRLALQWLTGNARNAGNN